MYQKLIIVGNLGGDPEMRYTPSGQAVTNFTVATNRKWSSNDGQQREETVWFRVSAWGRLAEVCNQYLRKGQQVFCEGRLTVDRESGGPRVWQAQDGSWRASYEMTAMEIKFLGQRDGGGIEPGTSSTGSSGPPAENPADGGAGQGIMEDEIPF